VAFPIVGIAASAGGLEALFELLPGLEPESAAAFVIIQHLDRDHKSLLAELLSRKTNLPVAEITEGAEVMPSRVYVIPPNVSITIANDRFSLAARQQTLAPHHPGDIFLNSLAETRGETAIGVILSGGDSDGAHGIQSVKHAGGITFAQEPESAKFPSMPKSAIDTGCVDYVLAPVAIGREISRLAKSPYLNGLSPDDDPVEAPARGRRASPREDEGLLNQVFRHLRNAYTVDFQYYKRNTLYRRLARRMALRKVETLAEYVALLADEPPETAALYQDFLIRVTSFFRDPDSFEALRSEVFPNICEGRPAKEPIRIWVPGCATGEEVYSIAIALMEYLGERGAAMRIQIFGTDVSDAAVEKARAGIYLENIAEDLSAERLERFFSKENGLFQISKRLRELCVFARHDVTRDPPFSRLDVVSCRNLLIYLDPTAQRRVMQMFHYALRPQGFLMLGPAEGVGAASTFFELVDKSHRVYTRRPGPAHTGLDLGASNGTSVAPLGMPASNELSAFSEVDTMQRETDRFLLSRYVPASVLVDDALNMLQFRGETSPYLEHASGVASLNLHRVLRPELLVEISPAIQEVRDSGVAAMREGLRVGELSNIKVEVVPFKAPSDERYFLILLEDVGHARRPPPEAARSLPESEKDRRLAQIERELAATREFLQATVEKQEIAKEEMKSAHEEMLSANEEFQSTNEELETAKEELQSSNEELSTTNEELRGRNRELSVVNGELQKTRSIAIRAQQYADAIIESVREPLVVLDANIRVLRANGSFYRDMKMRRERTEGQLLSELDVRQWDNRELLAQLESVLARNAPLDNYEIAYALAPGATARKLVLNARKIPGDAERQQLILLSIEDVTERDADAHELRQADRRKDEFLAMLAHELRNPLTPIVHAIQLLRRGDNGASPASTLYQMIERQTKRLARLVDELLDIARISRGHIELKRQTVDLAMLAKQAAEAAKVGLEERRHELTIAVPTTAVWVDGDPVRLEQIIANLLENAAKYTKPGGRIELKITQRRAEALLSVRDNGIGLAQENLGSIFKLFTQVDSTLARSGGGLGIGLTLVQRVVELHGGRIEARSAGLGHGSEFIVQIPLASALDDGAQTPIPALRDPEARDGAGGRVLIVDDNSDAADMIALLARHWGHEVALAYDAPTALELVNDFRPDHALIDIGLPGMNGYELANRLRGRYPDINLVAMTGYGRPEDRDAASAAGFDTHLVKPADIDELQNLLSMPGSSRPN
jgi:two-component system, chemotaxis family, CheB/CheR fusion protein